MKSAPAYSPPRPRETPATVADLILVKNALSALLVEETALMDKMQIKKVGELQERKLKLTELLERYMRYLSNHPEVLAQITPTEKSQLQMTAEEFQHVMRKNYNMLMVARAVNGSIVKCVTQIATKKDVNPIYNARGTTGRTLGTPLSVTLNQTI